MRGAQTRERGAVSPARGRLRCDFRFFIACAALRDEISGDFLCGVHRYANAARSRRRAGVHVATSVFLLPAPPCVTKFPPLFCMACTSLRQPISLLLRPASHTILPAKIPAPNLDKLPNPDDTGANAAAAAPLFCQPAETARRISCSLHSSAAAVLCKCAAAAGG